MTEGHGDPQVYEEEMLPEGTKVVITDGDAKGQTGTVIGYYLDRYVIDLPEMREEGHFLADQFEPIDSCLHGEQCIPSSNYCYTCEGWCRACFQEPSDKAIGIVEGMYNPKNWKFPTIGFTTFDHELANDVAYALDWFTGGHEMEPAEFGSIRVWSKGYYHYVGA